MGAFGEYIEKTGDCWLWSAGQTGSGYGAFYPKPGQQILAHRYAWARHHKRRIPPGRVVMHTCDNPLCVRPAHLVLGTHAENAADRNRKRRHVHGERVHTNKLAEAQVLAIASSLATGARGVDLAREYGVTTAMISRIKLRKAWKHLWD